MYRTVILVIGLGLILSLGGCGSTFFPDQPAFSLDIGALHEVILGKDGTVTVLGDNSHGQAELPLSLRSGGVEAIFAGGFHNIAIQGKKLVPWGDNTYGQLNIPKQVTTNNIKQLSLGATHSLALLKNGQVIGWGNNSYGQLNIPPGLTNVKSVTAGILESFAVLQDGTVLAWGWNGEAQSGLPKDLTSVNEIFAQGFHYVALLNDGTVREWGWEMTRPQSVPEELQNPATAHVKQLAVGGNFTIALRQNGTLIGWGNNDLGQLNFPPNLNNVLDIQAGINMAAALLEGGQVVQWGRDTDEPMTPQDIQRPAATLTKKIRTLSTSNWMSALDPDVPLNQIIIPGTHDSGTSTLSLSKGQSPDAPPFVEYINNPPWYIKIFIAVPQRIASTIYGEGTNAVIKSWGMAQSLSITEQLNTGIRYLDLRSCQNGTNIEICHGLYGANINSILDEVQAFLASHPSELVLLDFNHLNNSNGVQLANMIYQQLASNLVPNSITPTSTFSQAMQSPTLNGAPLDQQGRAIVFFDFPIIDPSQPPPVSSLPIPENYPYLFTENTITSMWPNVNDIDAYKSFFNKLNMISTTFNVVQGIFTETGGDIFDNIWNITKANTSSLIYWTDNVISGGINSAAVNLFQQRFGPPNNQPLGNILIVDGFNDVNLNGQGMVEILTSMNKTKAPAASLP